MGELTVGVRELRNNLSTYLRRVKAGEVVTITEHGQEVGHIMPPEASLEERMKVLAAAGVIEWNGEKLKPFTPEAVNRSDTLLSDIVVALRE
jgi:prevent-host-death family protein